MLEQQELWIIKIHRLLDELNASLHNINETKKQGLPTHSIRISAVGEIEQIEKTLKAIEEQI